MLNEVAGQVSKLRTTVDWDDDKNELVTTLKISVTGLSPEQLHQLFLFQRDGLGSLNFVISSTQAVLV